VCKPTLGRLAVVVEVASVRLEVEAEPEEMESKAEAPFKGRPFLLYRATAATAGMRAMAITAEPEESPVMAGMAAMVARSP
jgi:hypothetical protein